ncbi:CbiQ family ECF transporter T component [Lentzea flaviverrucosa]|uniref:Energy-coupling factor transport system permease protein n=1 Tax=Lentzea flaviverrucosa TaxID=200379 RepID=A0A1H9VM41_9PSEU|nr:CbiQ family ECF transporter T component [Lentzea flaviverrucosa]RDI23778.1 energy-coupling factor transport system permease protein [Lentzea flaviverrucosa]SES22427.1 energy-coupling factor transport system permease protein [Lentzea flaviverrucosa]
MKLHSGAWWLWALGLATAASRTTNPLLLGLVLAVAGVVVVTCRANTPWAGTYGVFLKFGLLIIGLRVLLHAFLGGVTGPTVLFTLPQVPLPDWAQGIRVGGPVSAEGLVFALYQGLLLATILSCVGAANALANPRRLLRSLPAALYEVSVAVVVALTVAPQLVASARSVRRARQLRGDTARGARAIRTMLVPVLEDALDRSLVLAASMDSRGYGRTAGISRKDRVLTGTLVLAGLFGLCIGTYGLLAGACTGWPLLALGGVLAIAGLRVGARRVPRTRYRPDRWSPTAIGVAASGMAGAVVLVFSADPALSPSTVPLQVPELPLVPALGVLLALAPVVIARET